MGTGRLQALLASHKVTKAFGKAKKNDGDDNGHDFDFAPKQVVVGRKSLPVTLKLRPWRQSLKGTSDQK